MTNKFPTGCKITNLHYGKRPATQTILYAQLRGPDCQVIISSTLEYIVDALNGCEFVTLEEYNSILRAVMSINAV